MTASVDRLAARLADRLSDRAASAGDARLVGPALAAWGSAAIFLGQPARLGVAAGWALAVAALLAVRTARHLAAMALATAAVAAMLAGLRVAHAGAGLLPDLAADEAVVRAEVVLTSDPRTVDGGFGDQVVASASAVRVEGRGQVITGRAPVLVFAGIDTGLLDAPLGGRVRVLARLAVADDRDLSAILLVSAMEPDVGEPAWWWSLAAGVRTSVDASVEGRGQAGELVPALVVGDDSELSAELADDFRTAGLTHLLAVSGTNLTLVLSALLLLARAIGVRGRGLTAVAVIGTIGFVLLARPDPSVLRAAAMGLVALAGLTSGDRRRGLRALSLAVLLLVLVDPWLARSPGFVLSVLATGAIIVLAVPWRDALMRWLPQWAAEAVAVPLAAQLVCTPVVAALSGQASLVAVFANILVAPAVGPATVLGLAAGLLGVALPVAGELGGRLAVVPAGWIVTVGRTSADLPGASIGWSTSPPALAALSVLCIVAVLLARPLLRRRWLSAACAALLVAVVLRPLPTPGWPPPGWVLVACSVGQGDALVLTGGDGDAVVVDAGPDPAAIRRCLRDLGVRQVSAVLLTHLHADHVDGLAGVLTSLPVGEVQVSPVRTPADTWDQVRTLAVEAGVPIRTVASGVQMSAGDVAWRVLWPPADIDPATSDESEAEGEGSPVNDASIVVAVEVRGVRLLLTGDIEPSTQETLLRAGTDLAADVLKVPHHGSARQSSEFFAAVGARLAVVTVGADNDYGHPAPSLLDGLDGSGTVVARTDDHGDVAVVAPEGDEAPLTWVPRGPSGGPD